MPELVIDIDNSTGEAIVSAMLTEGDRVLGVASTTVAAGETGTMNFPDDLEELRKDGTWGQ